MARGVHPLMQYSQDQNAAVGLFEVNGVTALIGAPRAGLDIANLLPR